MKDRGIGPSHLLVVVAAIGAALVAGAWYQQSDRGPLPPEPTEILPGPPRSTVTVHVSGAVRTSGLVRIHEGGRVADAVAAAGGALATADLATLNLAAGIEDGDHIVVPFLGAQSGGGGDVGDGRVDLNRATATELESLPGVGPVLAERIVTLREEIGRFAAAEDLLDVPGIGEAKLAELRDLVVTR